MRTILNWESFKTNERFNIDEYDPEVAEWEVELQNSIKKLERVSKDVELINTKATDRYKGPFATVKILGEDYKVWSETNDRLFIEDFIIDNTDEDLDIEGFIGTIEEIADAINGLD